MPKGKGEAKKRPGRSLVLVESPTKERTISRFLGKSFVVRSTYGHVRDLPERKMGVDERNGFEPTYVVLSRTKKLLPALKQLANKSKKVYLATDHDREGESIAWHLTRILNLKESAFQRITFHEITPEAVRESLHSGRAIDPHLVQAQQARRILDRLVGYRLSPLLWAKIKRGLSAGRVQSVATRLVAERDQEIQGFSSEEYWTVGARLEKEGFPPFEAELELWRNEKIDEGRSFSLFAEEYRVRTTRLKSSEQVDGVLEALGSAGFLISEKQAREVRRRAAPPFITSSLQQEASHRLSFSSDRTMRVAQSLYEGVELGHRERVGLITYMRTDSTSLASSAQGEAREVIGSLYGASYLPDTPPVFQGKVRGAQEAHEAIRPTTSRRTPDSIAVHLSVDQLKLYRLVWQRFIASQMADAVYDTVAADIQAGEAVFHATGRQLKFPGYLKVYREVEEEKSQNDVLLPPLEVGDSLRLLELLPRSHRTAPPPRYHEASLIRALEKHGIGRPSTYAPTLKTIVERGYVRVEPKDRRMFITSLGAVVTEGLKSFFKEIVDLSFTAKVEERLDDVAEGQCAWQEVVRDFYDPFCRSLQVAQMQMKENRIEPIRSEEKCPVCGKVMLLRESRFGKYLSCSQFPKCKGKISLDEHGKKRVPEETGEKCDKCGLPLVIRVGRRGRFLACSGFPRCINTFSLGPDGKKIPQSQPVETTEKCKKCSSPMWLRKGKRGHFLACSAYPRCRSTARVSKEFADSLSSKDPN
ncbi:MAG: type I DNA topoisomerase [Elusimicrobia bacterium]|nr:type I DNA topoisomerase [Elusimicrobiota bacterium]